MLRQLRPQLLIVQHPHCPLRHWAAEQENCGACRKLFFSILAVLHTPASGKLCSWGLSWAGHATGGAPSAHQIDHEVVLEPLQVELLQGGSLACLRRRQCRCKRGNLPGLGLAPSAQRRQLVTERLLLSLVVLVLVLVGFVRHPPARFSAQDAAPGTARAGGRAAGCKEWSAAEGVQGVSFKQARTAAAL